MNARRSIGMATAFLLLLAFATTARAEERNYWHHKSGHFENTSGNKWEEKHNDATFHFIEKERTEKFVELYDKGRDCWVRLYHDHCDVKFGNGTYGKTYEGKWGK